MKYISIFLMTAISGPVVGHEMTFDPNYCGPISIGKYKTIFKGFVNGQPVAGFVSHKAPKELCSKLESALRLPKSAREICSSNELTKDCADLRKIRKVK